MWICKECGEVNGDERAMCAQCHKFQPGGSVDRAVGSFSLIDADGKLLFLLTMIMLPALGYYFAQKDAWAVAVVQGMVAAVLGPVLILAQALGNVLAHLVRLPHASRAFGWIAVLGAVGVLAYYLGSYWFDWVTRT